MYNTIADVQEKNDAVIDAQKKNDASCECAILLWMYKRRMMQLQMYTNRMLKNKLHKGAVKIKYVPTKEQVASVLTKTLAHGKFEYF